MDAFGEGRMVPVLLCRDYSSVICAAAVQSFVMPSIVSEHDSAEVMGAGKDVRVRGSGSTVILCAEHIMAQLPQYVDSGMGKVLIGVEQHSSLLHKPFFAFFVFSNCLVNLGRIGGGVFPRDFQIGRGQ